MIEADLPFSPQTARKLMAVANHPVLSNHAHVRVLPPSWGTLYELTKLGWKDNAIAPRYCITQNTQ